jgi:hypothetical protein
VKELDDDGGYDYFMGSGARSLDKLGKSIER